VVGVSGWGGGKFVIQTRLYYAAFVWVFTTGLYYTYQVLELMVADKVVIQKKFPGAGV
jgi:hypothetical protein